MLEVSRTGAPFKNGFPPAPIVPEMRGSRGEPEPRPADLVHLACLESPPIDASPDARRLKAFIEWC